jgi:serine/threonine-protein kinase RsbT
MSVARSHLERGHRRAERVTGPAVGGTPEVVIHLDSEEALIDARRHARQMAIDAGLSPAQVAMAVTSVAELARNVLLYAAEGDITLSLVASRRRQGIQIAAHDEGPGIPDLDAALCDGFSTSGRLGLGLSGVKRLMDEFEIRSAPGQGTTVVARKWRA